MFLCAEYYFQKHVEQTNIYNNVSLFKQTILKMYPEGTALFLITISIVLVRLPSRKKQFPDRSKSN